MLAGGLATPVLGVVDSGDSEEEPVVDTTGPPYLPPDVAQRHQASVSPDGDGPEASGTGGRSAGRPQATGSKASKTPRTSLTTKAAARDAQLGVALCNSKLTVAERQAELQEKVLLKVADAQGASRTAAIREQIKAQGELAEKQMKAQDLLVDKQMKAQDLLLDKQLKAQDLLAEKQILAAKATQDAKMALERERMNKELYVQLANSFMAQGMTPREALALAREELGPAHGA
jgi:hypothetical protein